MNSPRERTYVCTLTGTEYKLPAGLSQHQYKIPNRWRYKHPNDKTNQQKCLSHYVEGDKKTFTAEEAIAIVERLNLLNSVGTPQPRSPATGVTGNIGKYFKSFEEIEEKKARIAGIFETKRYAERLYGIKKFIRELEHIPLDEVTTNTLSDWWYNTGTFADKKFMKTGHSQRGMRPFLQQYIAHILTRDDAGGLKFNNIFNPRSEAYALPFKKMVLRNRITISQVEQIKEAALKDGCHWLVNAIDLSLLTGVRAGAVCAARFSDIKGDRFYSKDLKSHAINRKDKVTLYIDKPEAPLLFELFDRCASTRNLCIRKVKGNELTTPAEHIIHDPYARIALYGSKEHPTQINREHLSHTFTHYARQVPELAAMSDDARPTFHEIRALFISIGVNDGNDLEGTQIAAGHRSSEMTKHYASGHGEKLLKGKSISPALFDKHRTRISAEATGTEPPAPTQVSNVVSIGRRK